MTADLLDRGAKQGTGRIPSFGKVLTRVTHGFLLASVLVAGSGASGEAAEPAKVQVSLLQTNFPFQGACITAPKPEGNTAMKGLAIRVGHGASVLFDTELLRFAAAWTGGFITTKGVAFEGGHGEHPQIDGTQRLGLPRVPGWATGKGEFKDPRPEPYGAFPADLGRWNGIHLHGDSVVLSYTIRGHQILEAPSSVNSSGEVGFVRTFKIDAVTEDLKMLVAEMDGAMAMANSDGSTVMLNAPESLVMASAVGLPEQARLQAIDNRIVLRLPKGTPASFFKVVVWGGPRNEASKFQAMVSGAPLFPAIDKGGPARWETAVKTKGVLAANSSPDGAYVVDQLTPPTENPWNRRVRFGGMDFFADGTRAALCTWDGDIWIVSGIDAGLGELTWKRFASGMYETIGLKIVNDVIYTSGRDQLTRYRDLNNDGEADFYENFNNEVTSTAGFHEFVFDLQTDREGNFYFAKAGPVKPGGSGFQTISAHAGSLMKVSKDGRRFERIATGFRAPNGIGVGPEGQLTTGDNEGTWMPTCPINWVKPGGFYGVEDLAHKQPVPEFTPPLCWLSKKGWDNSGGGQAWVTSDSWGPFKGELLHTSYGECALYLVMKQEVGRLMQGGVVRIPVKFTSSAMRPRFNPKDGQLYVAGLLGWQTKAAKITGFDRVRYTGKPVYSVKGLKVDQKGIHLTFTQPLDPKDAADVQNYAYQCWNYKRTSAYGSPEVSVTDPSKNTRDTVEVTGASLSSDGRTVTLKVQDLKPVDQMELRFTLKAKDGQSIEQSVLHTIHSIP